MLQYLSKRRNQKGFTVIELIVVIAVIAILVGVGIPRFTGHTEQAKMTKLLHDGRLLEDAVSRYYMDHGDWPRLTEEGITVNDLVKQPGVIILNAKGEPERFGEEVNLYKLDMNAMGKYVRTKSSGDNFILQNPVGSVYTLDPKTNPFLGGTPIETPTPTKQKFTIDFQVEGSGVLLPFMGVQQLEEGTEVNLIATPSEGWELTKIILGQIEIIESNYSFIASKDMTVKAIFAKEEIGFIKNFGGSKEDSFSSISTTPDGYIAVGRSDSTDGNLSGLNKGSNDAIIVKYDLYGNIMWKKNYGGSGNDSFVDVLVVSDGYIVAGNSASTDGDVLGLSKGNTDAILVKYDLGGNIVWKKNYGGTSGDHFQSITIASDGGYILAGYSSSTNGDLTGLNKGGTDAILVKYDVGGNVVWRNNFGGSGTDIFQSVSSTSDGYVVAGYSNSSNGDLTGLNKGGNDAIVVKYNLSGNVVWKKNYGGGSYDYLLSIFPSSDGYIAVGYSASIDGDLTGLNKGGEDAIIVKYDLSGNVLWRKNFGGSGADRFHSIRSIPEGYIVVGSSSSNDIDLLELRKGSSDSIVVKYDLLGNVIWNKNFGGSSGDFFSSVATTPNGYVAVGYSNSTNGDLEGLNAGGNDAILVVGN